MVQLKWLFLLLFYLCLSPILHGQSQTGSQKAFEQGYQAYMRNQFPIAEAHFRRAIQSASTNEDKAVIMKYLGISQYMRGDRRSALSTFTNAVLFDPKISIFKEEVLDVNVIAFFQRAKSNALKKQLQNQAQSQNPANARNSKRKKRKKTVKEQKDSEQAETKASANSSSSSFPYRHLMPFGAGHFMDGSPIYGTSYALGQVASLYIYLTKQAAIKSEKAENEETLARTDISQEVKDTFIADNSDFISVLESDAQIAISAFGVLYLSSFIHGWITSPEPSPPKKTGDHLMPRSPYSLAQRSHGGHLSHNHSIMIFPYKSGLGIQISLALP